MDDDPNDSYPNSPEKADIGVIYEKNVTVTVGNEPTGGIRLQKLTIDDGDNDSGNNIVRVFKYEKDINGCDGSTAAYLGRTPKYINNEVRVINSEEEICGYEECYFTTLSSSSLTNLSNYAGNIVGYREVWEWQGNNAENGQKYFKYQTFADINPQMGPNPYNVFLSTPMIDYSYKSGMLIEEHVYKANNDTLSKKMYDYEFNETVNSDSQKGIVARKVFDLACEEDAFYLCDGTNTEGEEFFLYYCNNGQGYEVCDTIFTPCYNKAAGDTIFNANALVPYAIEWYDVVTSWIYLGKETMQYFDDDGSGNYLETVTQHEYDTIQGNHTMPVATIMTNSDNKVHRTEHKFVFDMTTTPLWTDLISRNMISTPIETRVMVDGIITDGVKNDFSYFDGSGLPTTTQQSNPPLLHQLSRYEVTWNQSGTIIDNGWVLQNTIDEYEADGLIRKHTKEGWQSETYEWDNGQLVKKTFDNFDWEYRYYDNSRLISGITHLDGQIDSFVYDGLQRLETTISRQGNVTTNYSYQYRDGSHPNNFVKSETIYAGTDSSDLSNRTTFQYLDGLGRPIQQIEQAYSQNNQDVISVTEFDAFGRPFKSYEPFEGAGSSGDFVAAANWPSQMYSTDIGFEASPLSRSISTTPPDWKTSFMEYGVNTAPISIPGSSITYPAGTLFAETTIDPDATNTKTEDRTITFTDKKGRLILSRRQNLAQTEQADTYYIYDDKDRISKVIPPDATATDPDLIYTYTYSSDDLILTKKIPGQASNSFLYNDRDLVTFSQDGNMQSQGQWLHTQYDTYGRPTATGFVDQTPTNGNQLLSFDNALTTTCYDGCDLPGTPPQIYRGKVRRTETKILGTNDWLQTLNFYDAHGRLEKTESNNHLNVSDLDSEVMNYSYDFADNPTKALRTHTVGSTTTTVLEESTYDHSGRVMHTYLQVNAEPKIQTSKLVYTAKDEIQTQYLGKAGTSWLQKIDFSYRANGFLESMNQPTLGGTVTAVDLCDPTFPVPGNSGENDLFYLQINYDHLDFNAAGSPQYNGNIAQLIWRVRGRERQTYGFDYDFLNRLQDANYYDITEAGGQRSQTNKYSVNFTYADDRGNIGSISRQGLYWDGSCFVEDQIDDLSFGYYPGTNRLQDVNDTAPTTAAAAAGFKPYDTGLSGADYLYDENGNLINDPSKDLSISYNYLNLPDTVHQNSGSDQVSWLYDAAGNKLRKSTNGSGSTLHLSGNISSNTYQADQITSDGIVPTGNTVLFQAGTEIELQAGFETKVNSDFEAEVTTISSSSHHDYVNGIEYQDGVMEAIYHGVGRIYFDNGTPRYEYTITDHLGNARVTFADLDNDGTIEITSDPATNELLQENHYYPFGMQMDGGWKMHPDRQNAYQYNGKELNEDLGLYWLDYGARWYDPSIGRWNAVDPLAEEMSSWSPYNFTFDNPLVFIDPTGTKPEWIPSVDDEGNIVLTAERGDNANTLMEFFGGAENASQRLF
ncbi:DUF6443 domain-containing protein [Flavilitoribacter nigricans]|uniref:DUF6443 domain-containing protein n=1 Tax=Flavilitoribacter nigricans (strain ATCC 23147 / DSM 23189 / NBRC 102662 / NCIMB 1420 / SS-2) TaxID=1122177 RepID=A0A2D0N082_FLAN2|nr:DUF6443 domain-containing protein [Flavilitoribacter nigricans]PHN01895.1 hypothetical protein CRP01_35250 [Flavilitoribacter nigricans DSM 23189 = NBRC 102662]